MIGVIGQVILIALCALLRPAFSTLPLAMTTSINDKYSAASAVTPIVVRNGYAFVATDNNVIYATGTDSGIAGTKFKFVPAVEQNVSSVFVVDGDPTRVASMGGNFLVAYETAPVVSPVINIHSNTSGEEFQNEFVPLTHNKVVYFGTGCSASNGCSKGASFVIAVNISSGIILWNSSTASASTPGASSCANYPLVRFPGWPDVIAAIHDDCSARSAEVLLLNQTTGLILSRRQLNASLGLLLWLAPMNVPGLLGGLLIQQLGGASLLSSPFDHSFRFVASFSPWCFEAAPSTTTIPVAVGHFAVLACNETILLLDLGLGTVNSTMPTVSGDSIDVMMAVPTLPELIEVGQVTSCPSCGGCSPYLALALSAAGDLYFIDAQTAVVYAPSINASVVQASGITIFYNSTTGPILVVTLQGFGLGVANGYSFQLSDGTNPYSAREVASALSETPLLTLSSMVMPIGAAIYDQTTNQIFVANSMPYNILSGFEMTTAAADGWIAVSSSLEDSTPIGPNCIGYDFSDDFVFYATSRAIYSVNGSSGNTTRVASIPHPPANRGITLVSYHFICTSTENSLVCVDRRATNAPAWAPALCAAVTSIHNDIITQGDLVISFCGDGTAIALGFNPSTQSIITYGPGLASTLPGAVSDGVLFGVTDNELFAFDLATSDLLWNTSMRTSTIVSNVFVLNDFVYLSTVKPGANTSLSQFNRASGILNAIIYGVRPISSDPNGPVYVLGASGGLYGDGLLLLVRNNSVSIFDTHRTFYSEWDILLDGSLNLSLTAKPTLTTAGVYLHFTDKALATYNVFGFKFLWGSPYDLYVVTDKALDVSPRLYGGLLFFSKEAYITVADIVSSKLYMSFSHVDFLGTDIPHITAFLVGTTLSSLTRIIFSQGFYLVSMLSTIYVAPEQVTVDCGSLGNLSACNSARPDDVVQCQWCQHGEYCTSELSQCVPPRQCVLPLVSWANSPNFVTIPALVLETGFVVTANRVGIVALNTSVAMNSVLQLGNLQQLFSIEDRIHELAGGVAVGSDQVALAFTPATVFVANVTSNSHRNISFEGEGMEMTGFTTEPTAQFMGVVVCNNSNASCPQGLWRCELRVVDCLSPDLRSRNISLPELPFIQNGTVAGDVFTCVLLVNETFFVVRSVVNTTLLSVFESAANGSWARAWSVQLSWPFPSDGAVLARVDPPLADDVRHYLTIQTSSWLCVLRAQVDGQYRETTVAMSSESSMTVKPVAAFGSIFAEFGNDLVVVDMDNASRVLELEAPNSASILDILWLRTAEALFLFATDSNVYRFDFQSSTIIAAFAVTVLPQNNFLGLSFLPYNDVLAITFADGAVGVFLAENQTLVPGWIVASEDHLNGPLQQDPVTGLVYAATSGEYNLVGYDPNVTHVGWVDRVSQVFQVANYGVQFSATGDLFVLIGTTVLSVNVTTGTARPALTLQTSVSGESLAPLSTGLVCAADSYITQCTTDVNGGQSGRCAPPSSLFSPTIVYNGLVFTFCGDANSSFLAVDPITMQASYVGRGRSIFPGVVSQGIVVVVTDLSISGFSATPPFSELWSRPPAQGFQFCSNALRTGVESVTVGQCAINNQSMYAQVFLLASGLEELAIFWPGNSGPFANPITLAFVAAATGGVLGDGVIAVLTADRVFVLGVNGKILAEYTQSINSVLWSTKNLVTLTPEGLLIIDDATLAVYNVFTSEVLLSEFRFGSSLVPPLLMGSTVVWSTGDMLVATDIFTGQCYGQVGFPATGSPINAIALESVNSTRVVIGQSSVLLVVDMGFANLEPFSPLVPVCSLFVTAAACSAGRGNITIPCQWCGQLGYCTEGNNFCRDDCSLWTPSEQNACERATHCAYCSDYSVCVNAPSCQCSMIVGSTFCEETNGMCVYADGLCRVGPCFSFIRRGFNSLPFVLFLLGLVKDVLTLALVGYFEPLTARLVSAFKHLVKRRRFSSPRNTPTSSNSDLSDLLVDPEHAARSSKKKIVYLDSKFIVKQISLEPLSLESYVALLVDTAFGVSSVRLEERTNPSLYESSLLSDENDAHRAELHAAALLFMLEESVWITPAALARCAVSEIQAPWTTGETGSAEKLTLFLAQACNAGYFTPAIYISSSRFAFRMVHCISGSTTNIQLMYYLASSLTLLALTTIEVIQLRSNDLEEYSGSKMLLRFQLVGFRVMNSSAIGTIALLAVKYAAASIKQREFVKTGKMWSELRAAALVAVSRFDSSKLYHVLHWLYFATALPFVLAGSLVGAVLYPYIPAAVLLLCVALIKAYNCINAGCLDMLGDGAFSSRAALRAARKVTALDLLEEKSPANRSPSLMPMECIEGASAYPEEAAAVASSADGFRRGDCAVEGASFLGDYSVDGSPPPSTAPLLTCNDLTVKSVPNFHSQMPKAESRSRRIAYAKEEARTTLAALVQFLIRQEVPTVLLAVTLQSCFNYSVLYDQRSFFGITYLDVPGMDYKSRSFECFRQSLISLFDSVELSLGHCAQLLTAVVPFA